jgi:hypothetical protein
VIPDCDTVCLSDVEDVPLKSVRRCKVGPLLHVMDVEASPVQVKPGILLRPNGLVGS